MLPFTLHVTFSSSLVAVMTFPSNFPFQCFSISLNIATMQATVVKLLNKEGEIDLNLVLCGEITLKPW